VSDTGTTMDAILRDVTEVTTIMKQIASASEEQSKGISQVGIAITQMDGVTQQNASLVEEVSARRRRWSARPKSFSARCRSSA
jgi:methyl-accepting chemotaxis protein